MKTSGMLFFTMDLLKTIYKGLTYGNQGKGAELVLVDKPKNEQHNLNWKPYAGIGLMVIGGVFLMLNRKRSPTN